MALAVRVVTNLADQDDVTFTSAAWGDVLYRNATEWVNLAPGTDGRVLTTHGAGADPTWEPAATGTTIGDPVSGGTAGSVLFVDASGDLSQDNANLFWDDSLNRLGIGVNAPLAPLHIDGGAAPSTSQIRLTAVGGTGGISLLSYGADNSVLGFDVDWAAPDFVARDTTAALFYKTADMIGLYGNAGLTPGVGYTPTIRFRLNLTNGHFDLFQPGSGTSDECLLAFNNDVGRSAFELFSSGFVTASLQNRFSLTTDANIDGLLFTTLKASAPIDFYTAGAAAGNLRMRITAAGNVSIGTTSDMAKLAVVSTVAGTVGQVIEAHASQSANLWEGRSAGGASVYGTMSENGYWTTRKNSAPADGELVAGECATWFNPANGAASWNFKGKTLDGTVVTGTVALA